MKKVDEAAKRRIMSNESKKNEGKIEKGSFPARVQKTVDKRNNTK